MLVETVDDAERVRIPDPKRVAYVTQTTLSVDETAEIIAVLRRRFPAIEGPDEGDICYATTNRQQAVKELAAEVDLVLVIGSKNSSNSNRLVETAQAAGVEAHLIDDESEIDESWLAGVDTVGLTSGASVPGSARAAGLRLVPSSGHRGAARRSRPRGRLLPAAGRSPPDRSRRLSSAGRLRPVSRLPHLVPHRRRARARHAAAPVPARRPRLVVGLPRAARAARRQAARSSGTTSSAAATPTGPTTTRSGRSSSSSPRCRPCGTRSASTASTCSAPRGAGCSRRNTPSPGPRGSRASSSRPRSRAPSAGPRRPAGCWPSSGPTRPRSSSTTRTSAASIRSRRSWRRGRRSATRRSTRRCGARTSGPAPAGSRAGRRASGSARSGFRRWSSEARTTCPPRRSPASSSRESTAPRRSSSSTARTRP